MQTFWAAFCCAIGLLVTSGGAFVFADAVLVGGPTAGGGEASSPSFRINASVGQAAAGLANSPAHQHWLGLWNASYDGAAAGTIQEAKSLPDGEAVALYGKVASTFESDLAGFLYVQEPDASCGVRVGLYGAAPGLARGRLVNIVGSMTTTPDGERQINALYLTLGEPTLPPAGEAVENHGVGGSDWNYNPITGSGQSGVAHSCGPNNIGLLVRTTGKVTQTASDFFKIDDGSKCDGAPAGLGVRVRIRPAMRVPSPNLLVEVTGVSSCYRSGADLLRLLLARDQDDIVIHPDTDLNRIGQAKCVPEGVYFTLPGKVVIAAFAGRFYIEEADRSAGIRVVSGFPASVGDIVSVTGSCRTVDGEREITPGQVTKTGRGPAPQPLGLPNRSLGGGGMWFQPGVTGGRGANNIGLLVKTWGTVTEVLPDRFYIDDGSRAAVEAGHTGVRVSSEGVYLPAGVEPGAFAGVVGVSACAPLQAGAVAPALRLRTGVDVAVIRGPARGTRGLRLIPDGFPVSVSDGVVTAAFDGFFYIESPDRTEGIRVIASTPVNVGDSPMVSGRLATIDGERALLADIVWPGTSGNTVPTPLGLSLRTLGGGPLGENVPGVDGMRGANNVGLLVRVWGRVTQIDAAGQYLYLDDGSGLADGTSTETSPGVFEDNVGARVIDDPSGLDRGDYAVITGISSCFKDQSGKIRRRLFARDGGIIVVEHGL